ncbi:MAG: hypothetical protein ACYCYO_22285, partial [Bacilli bacterium]
MIKTVRFRHPVTGFAQFGIVEGNQVFNATAVIPAWTEPIAVWSTLRTLGETPAQAFVQVKVKAPTYSFTELSARGLLLPPVVAAEIWAAGVTYERSREARNAETKLQGSVYDLVYEAKRPEIFFKSTYERLVAPGQELGLRSDSRWMVPEPELGLVISASGELLGWTLGNDMSSRDIEGENPLYLPQAKIFSRSCSI